MKSQFGALALFLAAAICACIPPQQAAEEASNAADDAAYSAALNDCGTKAIELWQTSAQSDADQAAAQSLYAECKAALDKKFGRGPADAGVE